MSRGTTNGVAALIGSLLASATLALPGTAAAAAAPPAPLPPLAYTGYAANVTISSATLNVRVNPRGSAANFYIQYGPTAAYGLQTPTASAGAGTTGVQLSQVVAELQPAAVYHYRVVATSSAGTAVSPDAVFTTKSVPLSLTIATAPDPVVFGEPLSVFGTLTGTGNVGATVVLQADPFPYTKGFTTIGRPQTTNAAGAYLFALPQLAASATLRVVLAANPTVHSHGIVEHVALAVTLHVRPAARSGFLRFYGAVAPRQTHAPVVLERVTRGRHGNLSVVTVSRTSLKRGPHGTSRFSRVVRLQPGAYRVLVRAWGAQASGTSRSVRVR